MKRESPPEEIPEELHEDLPEVVKEWLVGEDEIPEDLVRIPEGASRRSFVRIPLELPEDLPEVVTKWLARFRAKREELRESQIREVVAPAPERKRKLVIPGIPSAEARIRKYDLRVRTQVEMARLFM